ncbi:hypothetical protein Tco_1156814 [Tanacetum coccineum]
MSAITDIKCALTQKALDAFCSKYHIPDEVHPVLPNQNDTMHERPAGKIGLYTRFFDYANFRLPLSVFLVDVIRHFRINISQLSVIGAAKVSHFEILCRVYEVIPMVGLFRCFYVNSKKNGWMSFSKCSDNAATCYTKPLDSLKNWNDHFFWVDDFACPAPFPWHTAKNVTRAHAPIAADFNAQDYATLVAHPSPFQNFPEAFLYLVGLSRYYPLDEETYPRFLHKNREEMDLFAFIHTPDPTKVKVVERERKEDEPLLLQTTVGRTVPLLPVAPDSAESELEASVDRLFDEGRSGDQTEQGGSAGSGRGADIQLVSAAVDTVVEDVAPVQPKHQRKRKTIVVDAGEASHPPKNLRDDHGTPSRPSVAGKSRYALQMLLAGAVLNPEVGVTTMPTLPFVTASVSTTPEREDGDHADSLVGLNLRTIGTPQRFIISSDPSHHSPDDDSGGADPNTCIFSDLSCSDFLSVTNGSHLDDDRVCREMVDEFAPPKFFASIRGMEHDQLFTEFNVGSARQMSLSVEVRMRAEYNVKERRRLKSVVEKKDELLKARDEEIENLKAQILLKEAEAAEAIRLRAEASNFETVEKSFRDEVNALKERSTILKKEQNALDVKVTDLEASVVGKERELTSLNAQLTSVKSQNDDLVDRVHELEVSSTGLQEKATVYEDCMGQLEKFQDDRIKEVNDKFDKLYADFIEMALHLEERFYPHLLTTIFGRRWLLTHGMELTITKCLHSPEYLYALGAAIGKAIEKGMQDGLSAGITHGTEGRALIDVAAYNPSAEADYISALQHLQNVNFSLLAELRSNKDASVDTLMNILRLEETLAERLGLTESQPHVDQLMVPIHHSPDKVVVGATALSLALDVSNIWVRKIKENIANQRSTLRDVFVPLSEPFSAEVLTGTEGTSDVVPATTDATTTLSITFASASTIAPISIDDYEVVGTDDKADADGNAEPFPNVDDAELNIPHYFV